MDETPYSDGNDHIEPYLAKNILRIVPGIVNSFSKGLCTYHLAFTEVHLVYVLFHPFLEVQFSDDIPAYHCNEEAGTNINGRNLPPEQPPEQYNGHLIDHRRSNEKRKRNAERHAAFNKPDEQRNGRA